MQKYRLVFKSYEALETHLRTCIHWYTADTHGQYDLLGLVRLMGALIDNLRERSMEHELEDIARTLSPEQRRFLMQIADQIRRSPPDDSEES